MKVYLGTIGIAVFLFLVGTILLLQARKNPSTHVVFEFEPTCNENEYMLVGETSFGSSEISLAQQMEPTQDYLLIAEGESLHSILSSAKVGALEIHELGQALEPFIRARDLAVGDMYQYSLMFNDNDEALVESFVIKKLDSNRRPIIYQATRESLELDAPKFIVKAEKAVITERQELVNIEVKGTLYASFKHLPFGHELMQRLMNIFAWRMRMPNDVLNKDKIEMLVVKKYAEDNFIGYGRILSVNYQQPARTLQARFFRSKDGKIEGIYDEHGNSLEKEFSLYPVYETVATSFQKYRFHPVRKTRIRHNGTDYRGVVGTRFFAIADGEVIEKRYDKMVGNMIRIKHNYGLHSEYFHANSLNEKLIVGSLVKRGQEIGKIGRTGVLCTGPHLHLGLYQMTGKKRKYVDIFSFRKKLKDLPALTNEALAEYISYQRNLLASIDSMKKVSFISTSQEAKIVER